MPNVAFTFAGTESTCALAKVDRSKLYGYSKSVVEDADGNECQLVTLAADGRTLLGAGGTAIATFSGDGRWLDRSDLKAVDLDGEPLERVGSSLKAPIELARKASETEFLEHGIRLSYRLEGELSPDLDRELEGGAIFAFPFSYRGGVSPDAGFLLRGADGGNWLLVGERFEFEFVSLEAAAAIVEEDDGGGEEDDGEIDFGMM